MSKLLEELKKKELFHGSITSLTRVMHSLDFTWKQESNRRYLMEKEDIVRARFFFLKEYVKNRKSANSLPTIFMDETWIFQRGAETRSWIDEKPESVRRPQGDGGRRYIFLTLSIETFQN